MANPQPKKEDEQEKKQPTQKPEPPKEPLVLHTEGGEMPNPEEVEKRLKQAEG